MRRATIVLGVFLVAVAGCDCKAPPPAIVQSTHFETAPPEPKTPPPVPEPMTGRASVMSGMRTTQYAQTVTVTKAGELTELQFGPLEQPESTGNLIVELRPAKDGIPDDNSPVLACVSIPHSSPVTRSWSGISNLTRIDLSPFAITVKKDDVVAVCLRSETGGNYALRIVLGNGYGGGDLYSRVQGGKPWSQQASLDLHFRLYAEDGASSPQTRPTTGPTTMPATQPADKSPRGAVVAESMPTPTVATTRPAPPKIVLTQGWQVRGTVFQSETRWVLELTAFNGSNQSRSISRFPSAIAVVRKGDAGGFQVSPQGDSRSGSYYSSSYGYGASVNPNEGFVKHFILWDKPEPLKPGDYRATVIMAPEMAKTLDVEFTVK